LRSYILDTILKEYGYTPEQIAGFENSFEQEVAVIREKRNEKNKDLLDNEVAIMFEEYINREIFSREASMKGSKHTKQRKISRMNPEMMQFYHPLAETIDEYFKSMIRAVEARRFLTSVYRNKVNQNRLEREGTEDYEAMVRTDAIKAVFGDVNTPFIDNHENAIGNVMAEYLKSRTFSKAEFDGVRTYLTTLFGRKRMGGFASALANISYQSTLAQLPKAGIRQIGDNAFGIAFNGIMSTIDAQTRILFKKRGKEFEDDVRERLARDLHATTTEVMGGLTTMQEVARSTGFNMNKATELGLALSGLNLVDTFFANSFIEGAAINMEKMLQDVKIDQEEGVIYINYGKKNMRSIPLDQEKASKMGIGELKMYRVEKMLREMQSIFGNSFKQTTEAMQRGDFKSMDAQFMLYKQLGKVRPIGISNQPALKTTMGNMKVLYTLKTFSLKFIDIWRQEIFREVKEGIQSGNSAQTANGLAKGAKLIFYFTLFNGTANFLIDLIMNRPLDKWDILLDSVLESIAINRWQGYMLNESIKRGMAPHEAVFKVLAPPAWNIGTDVYKSMKRVIEGKESFWQGRFWRYVPFLGIYESWFGEYAIKYGRNKDAAIRMKINHNKRKRARIQKKNR
jgi:hypothetical protein